MRTIIPFPGTKKFSPKFSDADADKALADVAKAAECPIYLVHIDENTGYVNVTSALTHTLTFQKKKDIARAVSAAIRAI
jgi:hypothetical protein